MDDQRPDGLLEECGRIGFRFGLAFAWTDGLEGAAAKACSRGGPAAWKSARPLPANEQAAAAFFAASARRGNPAVVLGASGLVGVEVDGELEQIRVEYHIPVLPKTVAVKSARGVHRYYRPPAGRAPLKVQLDPGGVVVSGDGYLVGAGAIHPSGVIYSYVENGAIAELPVAIYDRLVELAAQGRAKTRRRFGTGEPIPEGHRDVALFWLAVELLRGGGGGREALARLHETNRAQCTPPLADATVVKQFKGAVRFVAKEPTGAERARAEARSALVNDRAGADRRPRGREPAGAWEEPVPLRTRGDAPAFELELLPDWLGAWAATICAEKGAALDLGANLALAVASGAIARNVQVSPRPGWYEPTNLYVLVALDPGQAKTPVFKAALRPVRTLERQRMQDWEAQVAAVQVSDAILDRRRKDLVNAAAGESELDPDSLQERIEELRVGLGELESTPKPRLLVEDITPEALAGLLADHGRIIAASDEGGALFENLAGRYAHGSTSWDTLNKSHSGADLVVDRRSSGAVIVYDPAITLAIATQPATLWTIASKPGAAGRGVLARPLYALPAPVYREGLTPEADPAVLDEYARRIRSAYDDTPELGVDDDDHPRPTLLTFTAAARTVFEAFERELLQERRELGADWIDSDALYLGWLSKLAGQTARLAAVLHAAANWTGGYGTSLLAIDEATVDRAVALARYYRAHALRVFGAMGELPEQRRAIAILGWLRSHGADEPQLTVREVHRSRGKGTTAAQVRVALKLLEEHGYVRVDPQPRSGSAGRASERVQVHPQISNLSDTPDKPDTGTPRSGVSGLSEGFALCADHPGAGAWKARDGVWRCSSCTPPLLAREAVEERRA